jgi:hypothetical protein
MGFGSKLANANSMLLVALFRGRCGTCTPASTIAEDDAVSSFFLPKISLFYERHNNPTYSLLNCPILSIFQGYLWH